MITMQDIDSAIAECQGARDPDARCVTLLAALYTVKDHMTEPAPQEAYSYAAAPAPQEGYSYAAAPAHRETVRYMGQSPFAQAIYGRPANDIWLLMDDLMTAVRTQAPRLYDSIMRQL